jgi:hypothetical protein
VAKPNPEAPPEMRNMFDSIFIVKKKNPQYVNTRGFLGNKFEQNARMNGFLDNNFIEINFY